MNALADRIIRFIEGTSPDDFESLALELFATHYARNLPFRRLCDSVTATPQTVQDWRDIPAVPALAFKSFDLTCVPTEECLAVFHSSGTTMERTSRHWMSRDALAVYDASLQNGYGSAVDAPGEIWAVMPSATDAPRSSLSHMLASLRAVEFAGEDLGEFASRLAARCAEMPDKPLTLFGTAFGLAELMERAPSLPFGSIVIETGGFKGKTREIPRDEFYTLLRDVFGVPDKQCFSEYGMCEMASQFYSQGVDGALHGPHWVRTRCIDPLTNTDAAPGRASLLRHYDLANVNSVLALQTQDQGILTPDGGFRLAGRAPLADLRGCSLTAEEMWSLPLVK
jgi:hypothetical protein